MSACAGRVTAAALALLVAAAPGCAKKRAVSLEMTREVVITSPTIQEITFDPAGHIDTTETDRTINVRMNGDAELQATFDVDGRLQGQKMEEAEPGVYNGSFVVKQGEVGQIWVTGHLLHEPTGAKQDRRSGEPLELIKKVGEAQPTPDICDAGAVAAFDQALQAITTHFEFNKFNLSEAARAILESSPDILASHPACLIEIHGHADDVGSPQYNMDLSKNRATSVAGYLESRGVPVGRMAIRFHGEEMPVDTTGSPEGRARNRRVEVHAAPVP